MCKTHTFNITSTLRCYHYCDYSRMKFTRLKQQQLGYHKAATNFIDKSRFLTIRKIDTMLHYCPNSIYHHNAIPKQLQIIARQNLHTTTKYLNLIRTMLYNTNRIIKARPLFWGAVIAAIKSVFADLFAQSVIERKKEINWERNFLFFCVGLFWSGYMHYLIYYMIYPRLFAGISHWHWFPKGSFQSAIDQTCHSALIYYPFFYSIKACIYDGFSIDNCRKAVHTYWHVNFWQDFKVLVAVWYPANLITFGFVPIHLRVPWLAVVSFGWVVVLSLLRGEKEGQGQVHMENSIDLDGITMDTQMLMDEMDMEKQII